MRPFCRVILHFSEKSFLKGAENEGVGVFPVFMIRRNNSGAVGEAGPAAFEMSVEAWADWVGPRGWRARAGAGALRPQQLGTRGLAEPQVPGVRFGHRLS